MQPYRLTCRALPRACKPPTKRTLFTTPFFPPTSISSDFAPLFRLLDSATADLVPAARTRAASFTPRFDVRELGSQYELQGELPGIEQKDLQIEFVDERTLVIRGRTTNEYSSDQNGDEAAATTTTTTTKAVEAGDNAEEKHATEANTPTNYRRPSVSEDDSDYVDAGAEAKTANPAAEVAEQSPSQQSQQQQSKTDITPSSSTEQANAKYWISERSVGEFERRFSFPGRVDQDAVRASLKNGILSVVVPKIVARGGRRVVVE